MARSMGGVPGEVMLGGGRSSTSRSAMLSTLIWGRTRYVLNVRMYNVGKLENP